MKSELPTLNLPKIALNLREENGVLLVHGSTIFFSLQEPLVLTTILSLFVKLHNVRVSIYHKLLTWFS